MEIKNSWPEGCEYPVEKLPRKFFIDSLETGESYGSTDNFRNAVKVLAHLNRDGAKYQIRYYAPSPEKYEELCEKERKRRRWDSSFGA